MNNRRNIALSVLPALALLVAARPSEAVLVNLGPGSFTAAASEITFDEVALGTVDPVYNFTGLTNLGNVTVSFGQQFVGQIAGGGFPVTLTGHTPTGPLALDPATPGLTQTVDDGAASTNPVLSGSPIFNGPISILFSVPVAGVGLTGGYFDGLGSTTIEAYDVNGNILGSITNSALGFEFYGLADSTGQNVIAGISFFITGDEPAGFEIDNVTFGAADVINPAVPEPSGLLALGAGLLGLLASLRRRS